MKRYGTEQPPEYDLSKCTVKTAVFHGDVDDLSTPGDVKWLLDKEQSKWDTDNLLVHEQFLHSNHDGFWLGKDMSFFDNEVVPMIIN